jgi:hypothetical protein
MPLRMKKPSSRKIPGLFEVRGRSHVSLQDFPEASIFTATSLRMIIYARMSPRQGKKAWRACFAARALRFKSSWAHHSGLARVQSARAISAFGMFCWTWPSLADFLSARSGPAPRAGGAHPCAPSAASRRARSGSSPAGPTILVCSSSIREGHFGIQDVLLDLPFARRLPVGSLRAVSARWRRASVRAFRRFAARALRFKSSWAHYSVGAGT